MIFPNPHYFLPPLQKLSDPWNIWTWRSLRTVGPSQDFFRWQLAFNKLPNHGRLTSSERKTVESKASWYVSAEKWASGFRSSVSLKGRGRTREKSTYLTAKSQGYASLSPPPPFACSSAVGGKKHSREPPPSPFFAQPSPLAHTQRNVSEMDNRAEKDTGARNDDGHQRRRNMVFTALSYFQNGDNISGKERGVQSHDKMFLNAVMK
jgi:hypothetical protein